MEELGKILPAVFKRQLHRVEPPILELLVPLWPRVVGRAIARQCRPVSFTAGTLTVATSCPTWAVQLRQLSEEIREEINRFLGSTIVRKLRIRHDLTVDNSRVSASEELKSPNNQLDSGGPTGASRLEPEWAEVLRRSHSKYFARQKRKVH